MMNSLEKIFVTSIPSIQNVMIFHVQLFLFHGKLVVWVGGFMWLQYLGIPSWLMGLLLTGSTPYRNPIFTIQLSEYPPHFPTKNFNINPNHLFLKFFFSQKNHPPFAQLQPKPPAVCFGWVSFLKPKPAASATLKALAPSLAKSWCQFRPSLVMEICLRPVSAEVAGVWVAGVCWWKVAGFLYKKQLEIC